ncbi:GNAT family N-acetyltransferase [Phreatobacter sp. AB_2022a]|uniref:GNAT family N-acetyltransferase n=1 Tax=Phreatobacter sp. AB_2022a TaxID=3003134 RepID=UPI00228757E4|nr:GNAT family N-acetyltransferase [Phreatobacter sp. AB_2022a]MCZ0737916.1 GNAT family N-acetyltransferase [Phreatobacter sp. AB_2022a]
MIAVTSGDVAAAYAVTEEVYGRTSPYVPPMRSDFARMFDPARNPFVTEGHGRFALFVAWRGGRPVGRIAASVHDASNLKHGTRRAQFGFFDCADDAEVASALLGAAEDFARAAGMAELSGNFNLTAMQQVGVVTAGFDSAPYTDMVYSPPHIAALLTAHGYAPAFPMTTFETDLTRLDPQSLIGPAQQAVLDDPAFQWMPIDRAHFDTRLAEARAVLNDGFAENPMFVPTSPAEYRFQAGDMMWVIDKRISCLVHHAGQPVGVVLVIPDLNPLVKAARGRMGLAFAWHFLRQRLTNRRAVLIYQSVSRAMHGRGINGAMLARVVAALKAAGYDRLGTTWIADINRPSLRQMEKLGARPLHRLHLFTKALTPAHPTEAT